MAAVLALLLVCLPMGLPPVYSSPVEDRCGWGPDIWFDNVGRRQA